MVSLFPDGVVCLDGYKRGYTFLLNKLHVLKLELFSG